jgi:hypothetical protein
MRNWPTGRYARDIILVSLMEPGRFGPYPFAKAIRTGVASAIFATCILAICCRVTQRKGAKVVSERLVHLVLCNARSVIVKGRANALVSRSERAP